MIDFVINTFKYPFLQKALAGALLCSIGFGFTGPFVIGKRLTYLAGGIAHAVMGGIGIAYYLHIDTTLGAIASAFLFALIITLSRDGKASEDTLVSTLWATGMSIGVIFMYITPGYNADLASFIFGNVLMVQSSDILLIIVLDIAVIVSIIVFYYHFVYISFDESFMEVRGIKTILIYFFLLLLISITVVITIKIVGLIMVIALITLPSVTSALFIKGMRKLILASTLVGMLLSFFGIYLAYTFNIPAGATIILLAATVYFVTRLIKQIVA
jgi:zinc transport system permease protein